MRVIVAGSRAITDQALVDRAIARSGFEVTEIVSGGARGVDRLGEAWAKRNRVAVKVFPADWGRFGKRAGPIRNREMAQYGEALVLVWTGDSPGSRHMLQVAKEKGMPIFEVVLRDGKARAWKYRGR